MNTPLRDEAIEIEVNRLQGLVKMSDKSARIMAKADIDQILNLIASKMPEKIDVHKYTLRAGAEGWNQYHDTFKSILKGGTDE